MVHRAAGRSLANPAKLLDRSVYLQFAVSCVIGCLIVTRFHRLSAVRRRTVGEMNHTMSDVTMSHWNGAAKLLVVNETAGAGPDKLDYNMSSSSSTAVDAMNNNVQFLMQNPSGSSNEAGGDLRKEYAKVRQENSKGDIDMVFEKQLVGDADGLSSNSTAKSVMRHPSGSLTEARGDPCKG